MAASAAILGYLNEHIDNLLPSNTVPKAANGTEMHPVGKLPVRLKLGDKEFSEDLHIYPNVCEILISWKACKNLGILPDCYLHPSVNTNNVYTTATVAPQILDSPPTSTNTSTLSLNKDSIVTGVFDGVIRAMDGEKFHIYLTNNAKPFCVTSPCYIHFAYRDKLAAELELLQEQNIITPVIKPTDWCAPIVATPKKHTDSIRMCVDLSHLNRFIRRERHQSCSPAEAVANMAASNARYFMVLDGKRGTTSAH